MYHDFQTKINNIKYVSTEPAWDQLFFQIKVSFSDTVKPAHAVTSIKLSPFILSCHRKFHMN